MEDPLIKKQQPCDKHHKVAFAGMSVSLLLVITIFVLSLITLAGMNKRFDTVEDDINNVKSSIHDSEPILPSKFVLHHTAYTPVVSQGM